MSPQQGEAMGQEQKKRRQSVWDPLHWKLCMPQRSHVLPDPLIELQQGWDTSLIHEHGRCVRIVQHWLQHAGQVGNGLWQEG